MTDDLGDDYGASAARTYYALRTVLGTQIHARTLDPVELWDAWHPSWPAREPGVTWLQWQAAYELAREHLNLPPYPKVAEDIAYIFAMDDPEALERFKEMTNHA